METKPIVLCDTNILIEFYKNNATILSELRSIGQENIAVSIVTAGELLYGALNKNELKVIKNDLSNLLVLSISGSIENCFLDLMSKYTLSHKLSLPDGLIAATAIVEDVPLYTLNIKDFKYIQGLRLHSFNP